MARRRTFCNRMRETEMPFAQHLRGSSPPGSLRSTLFGGLAALMVLAPALAGAQTTRTDTGAEKNITTQVQKDVPVALPSLSPLVQRASPAVVSIAAQVNSEATG